MRATEQVATPHQKKSPPPRAPAERKKSPGITSFSNVPLFEAVRAEFLGNKSSWEELDKADWRKVGDGVGGFFGHGPWPQIGHPGIKRELAKAGGNGNGGRILLFMSISTVKRYGNYL